MSLENFHRQFQECRSHRHKFLAWSLFIPCSLVLDFDHYDDVIMTMLASQITSLTVVYSIVYSGVNQRKHQSSASLAFVWEIHRGPVNFPHKGPVTRKMFPFDDVIMRFWWRYALLIHSTRIRVNVFFCIKTMPKVCIPGVNWVCSNNFGSTKELWKLFYENQSC